MGLIYLITNDYIHYKIGYTNKSINERISSIQTGNSEQIDIIKTFNSIHCSYIEKMLHKQFHDKRIKGEWFELNDNDIKTFESSCKKYHDIANLLQRTNHFFKP